MIHAIFAKSLKRSAERLTYSSLGNGQRHGQRKSWAFAMSRAGAMTALCKGTGTINGNGDYHFLLTSIDGDQAGGGGEDTLRIRIWSDSEGLIYDNQPNASEFAAPMTVLSGGSIVIHH
jgi:hypothetical protein